jgi:hypothetical protein
LLPTYQPDKVQKVKWLKLIKAYYRAFMWLITGTEVTEQALDKAEKAVARLVILMQDESDEDDGILIPGTPLITGEAQGGTTIILVVGTPERLLSPFRNSSAWLSQSAVSDLTNRAL